MSTLKQDLQKMQTQAGADPKIAPHAWKAADQFYKNIVKAGNAWTPSWKAQPKGTRNAYNDEYDKASAGFAAAGAPASPTDPLATDGSAAMGGGGATQGGGLADASTNDPNIADAEYEVRRPGQRALAGNKF